MSAEPEFVRHGQFGMRGSNSAMRVLIGRKWLRCHGLRQHGLLFQSADRQMRDSQSARRRLLVHYRMHRVRVLWQASRRHVRQVLLWSAILLLRRRDRHVRTATVNRRLELQCTHGMHQHGWVRFLHAQFAMHCWSLSVRSGERVLERSVQTMYDSAEVGLFFGSLFNMSNFCVCVCVCRA